MRFTARILPLLVSLTVTFAYAQTTPNTPFQHVIIVVQENRTPDNLFGSDLQNNPRRLPNAHLASQGLCGTQEIPLQATGIDACFDPDHSHAKSTYFYGAWETMYDAGLMDGACNTHVANKNCTTLTNLQYTYVNNQPVAPVVYGIVEPYFQIATNYGYANWMFQTNQGPSFPAHQFLFTGTSAPAFPNNSTACYNAFGAASPCYQWFATELAYNVSDKNYGCIAQNGEVVLEAYPGAGSSNTTESPGWTPVWEPQPEPGYPCYDHNTMTDLLENNTQGAVSWRYYSDTSIGANPQGNLWTAPNAIEHICLPSGGNCTGPDWPGQTNYNGKITLKPPQILTDLGAVAGKPCNLQQVSWVIPDGSWSDHPGTVGADGGPSWVAAIVNAVGGYTNGGQKLPNQCTDTINGKQVPYWQDTVILVTWDDWGGFYDDVLPWNCSPTVNNGNCQGYSNSTGGQYVYGFRVPLLVVSAWTPQGYVSGSPSQAVQPYVHDFGSILNFTEWAFGKSQTSIGEISPNYHYADFLAPDAPFSDNNITQYSLSDFFVSFSNQPRPFTQIIGWKYDTSCFLRPTSCFANYPIDPDNDAIDND